MMKSSMFAVSLALVAGCVADQDVAAPSTELRALGVERLEVEESASSLVIAGLDRDGRAIAGLDLGTGWFLLEHDERGFVDGRQMTVYLHEGSIEHGSEGYDRLNLPRPFDPRLVVLLTDPTVAAALSRWGIELDGVRDVGELTLGDEHSYGHSCTSGTPLHHIGLGTSCQNSTYGGCTATAKKKYFKSGSEWGELRCCYTQSNVVERACTTPNGSTSCGTAGGNGCAVCWLSAYVGGQCGITGSGGSCTASYCGGPPPP